MTNTFSADYFLDHGNYLLKLIASSHDKNLPAGSMRKVMSSAVVNLDAPTDRTITFTKGRAGNFLCGNVAINTEGAKRDSPLITADKITHLSAIIATLMAHQTAHMKVAHIKASINVCISSPLVESDAGAISETKRLAKELKVLANGFTARGKHYSVHINNLMVVPESLALPFHLRCCR